MSKQKPGAGWFDESDQPANEYSGATSGSVRGREAVLRNGVAWGTSRDARTDGRSARMNAPEVYEGQQYATRESIDWEASFDRMKAERDGLAAVIEQAIAALHDTSVQIHTRNDDAATILREATS